MTTLRDPAWFLMVRVPLLRPPWRNGIANDIEKYLHQLIAIAAHAGKNGFELCFDARRARAQIESAKLDRVGDNRVDVEKRALCGNLPRKTEEVANESFGSAGLVANLGGSGAGFIRQRHVVGEKIGITKDSSQRIVDFVGSAGCQLPERDELFRLHHLRLEALQVFHDCSDWASNRERSVSAKWVRKKINRAKGTVATSVVIRRNRGLPDCHERNAR